MKMLREAILITWAGFGLIIDKEIENQENYIIYVSVPKSSFHKDAYGEEMSGDFLAKRFKEILIEMGVKRLTVKYKIRDEIWTETKKQEAELNMRKKLFGSQY